MKFVPSDSSFHSAAAAYWIPGGASNADRGDDRDVWKRIITVKMMDDGNDSVVLERVAVLMIVMILF